MSRIIIRNLFPICLKSNACQVNDKQSVGLNERPNKRQALALLPSFSLPLSLDLPFFSAFRKLKLAQLSGWDEQGRTRPVLLPVYGYVPFPSFLPKHNLSELPLQSVPGLSDSYQNEREREKGRREKKGNESRTYGDIPASECRHRLAWKQLYNQLKYLAA